MNAMMTTNNIDFSDIQGIVRRGYGSLPAACYLLISIQEASKALPWLRDLAGQITFADIKPYEQAVNLAVTYHGLARLDLTPSILNSFSDEFRSGMNTPHKRHILGDQEENSPEYWLWGGPATEPVDLLLLCYAKDKVHLNTYAMHLQNGMSDNGMTLLEKLDSETLLDGKEHFGFRDSIGQPYIDEFNTQNPKKMNPVPLGEILLGYPNGYDRYTQRPLVSTEQDPHNILDLSAENKELHDLGLNGTYLVFRQLFQDVPKFWKTLNLFSQQKQAALKEPSDPSNQEDAIMLASKMVGRWPSGTALVQSPDKDDPSIIDRDNFSYHETDQDGMKCPFGAHIRRTHPRDSLEPEPGSEKSIEFSNRHRLLRRGRAYGKPFDPSMNPSKFLEDIDKEVAPVARGLHFICLNANIGRQFEFVQHTWANNPNFNGLYQDPDPIIGSRTMNGLHADQFTIQKFPSRYQLDNLPSFVQTRGGAYFFLPSRRALAYLLS
jgi:Dyp-type peroxidase family